MNNVGANSNIPDFARVAQASASRVQSRANQSASKLSAKSTSQPSSSTPISSEADSFSNVLATTSNQASSQPSSSPDNHVSADSSTSSLPTSSEPTNVAAPKDSQQAPVVPVGFSGPKVDKSETSQVEDSKTQNIGEAQNARQVAMQVFLDRMQTEVGVSPDKLVEAFSKLSVQDLAEAPEDTADKLISALKLDPKNSKKAAGLYGDMLGMMAAAGMAQYLSNNNQQAQFHVIDKDQANLQSLRSNINNMSDKFFRTGPFTPAEPNAQAADQQNQTLDASGQPIPEGMQPVTDDRLGQAKAAAALAGMNAAGQATTEATATSAVSTTSTPMGGPTVLQTLKAAQPNAQNAAAQAQPANPVMNTATIAAAAAALNANVAAKANAESLAEDADQNETTNIKMNSLSADATGSAAAAAGATTSGKLLAMDHAANGDASKSSKDDKDGEAELQGLQAPNHQTKNVAGEKNFNVNTTSASQAEMQANVKEIISQAQFLASKGGGEMKMNLAPEGLGQLSLKVKMVNGQLNIEMVTANDAAKKVLEKGLNELKDSLAVHKIHLDAIKIDTPKDLAGQMNQRQQEMEQGFQQKFLGDFRERNNANRHEMFEFPGPAVPSSQTRDRAANSVYSAAGKRKDARRLDLVA